MTASATYVGEKPSRSRFSRVVGRDDRPYRVGEVRVGAESFYLGGSRNVLAVFDECVEVQLDGFPRHQHRLVDGGPGREATRQIGNRDAVVGFRVLMNSNGKIHESTPSGASHDTAQRAGWDIFL